MTKINDIGNLMYLHLDEIEPGDATDVNSSSIAAAARLLNAKGGRNWVPTIVKEIARDRYQVIGNSFVFAVAVEANLKRVWCIVADDLSDTEEIAKVLAREKEAVPKINLSEASRDEIKMGIEYIIRTNKLMKTLKVPSAISRIEEAPDRLYWQTLDPIANLKCGITKGKKLDSLKEVFYLSPKPKIEEENPIDTKTIETIKAMSLAELKIEAKKGSIPGTSKMKKADLVKALINERHRSYTG
jgi:hypothetical protein